MDEYEFEKGEKSAHIGPRPSIADRIKEAIFPPDRENLLKHEDQQHEAAGTQDYVVCLKECRKTVRTAVCHERANPVYSKQVNDQSHDHLLERWQGGFSMNKSGEIWWKVGKRDVFQQEVSQGSHMNEERKGA
jgi:hypothetical protein